MKQALSYCGNIVREQDRDRFLLSMFAPPEAREDLWALFAFNHEIAKTREVVSEMQLGLIRLQWWREAIGKIYDTGEAPEHEILQALKRAIQKHNLPREYFEHLIYAREFDLENVLPSNVEGFLNYADFTSTPLMKLAVQVTGSDPEVEQVQPVAMNYAITGIVRAVPFHASQRRCYLPEDLMQDNEVKLSKLYDMKPPEKLPVVVEAVVGEVIRDIRPGNILLKAAQKLANIYAGQAKRAKYDVFSPKMAVPPAFRELRLVVATRFL